MGVALYRKYRSKTLKEVVGQDHVTTLLANALKQGKIAHAYLFTGPKGVGKTSIARILAHEINGLPYTEESTHLDIIEIDAASNNGVEDIRDLRERVQMAPVNAKKKVYIIDEVHMLSKPAFNALLKTLEEPPEHVVFILATTDIDKVPDTIISRTQRHSFRRASEDDIVRNLRHIATNENISVDDDVLRLVAKHSDGSFRDSVSLFDQLVGGAETNTITHDEVTASLGLVSTDTIHELINAASNGDIGAVDSALISLEQRGVPARTTAIQLIDYLRTNLSIHPEYATLLDGLLEVSRSHHPELKLLTTLSMFNLPSLTVEPAPASSSRSSSSTRKATSSDDKKDDAKVSATPNKPAAAPKKRVSSQQPFDWEAFIAYVRKHHVALHSVLCKCDPSIDGTTLILYTKSAFYKKKLDDAKYRALLTSSLEALGYDMDIKTIASSKPLEDSQAARVAAIMGGGEEVSVDDA